MRRRMGILSILLLAWGGTESYLQVHAGSSIVHSGVITNQVQTDSDSSRVDRLLQNIKETRFSEPDKARLYADTALIISKQANLKSREAEVLNQLGIIASVLGDAPTALEFFLDVLRVREEIGDLVGIARIQNNLGILYKNLQDYDKSLEFHQKSLTTKKELADSIGIARSLNNIGEIYQQQLNTTEAKKYFEESLFLMLKFDLKEGLSAVYNNLGEVYRLDGAYKKAIELHSASLEIEKELGNVPGIGLSYLNIASLFKSINQYDIAINNYLEAITYFKQINDLGGLRNSYNDLAIAYAEIENFKESLSYFQLHSALKDSIVSVDSNRRIAELQAQYESEKQDQEIALLNERSALQESELKQQKYTRNLLLVVVILLIVIAVILYLSDRSKKRTNKLLSEQKDQIQEAAALKSQFLSVMSHEIRTPMNAVVGMANLLVDENPREDQMKYLDTLLFSSNNLLNIVNDVLDYSKAEAGKISLENIEFRLLQLLLNIHQSFYNQSVDQDIYLKFEHDEKIPEVLKGDPTRLTQVLNNLVSNALKFTEKGGSVIVNASLEEQSKDIALLSFRITDTGIGISPDKTDLIFESFVQADGEIHRKYGGTGLGLPISKKIIERMGGKIKVVSTEGKGSTFSFSIPLEKGDPNKTFLNYGPEINNLENLSDIRIMVVEDNPVNIQVIKLFLDKWGASQTIAVNGKQAVKLYQEQEFDLIFMDLHMPVMDGYESSIKIRELEEKTGRRTPIIALTASNVFEDHTKAYDAGVDHIMPKPFDPQKLHQAILCYKNKQSKG